MNKVTTKVTGETPSETRLVISVAFDNSRGERGRSVLQYGPYSLYTRQAAWTFSAYNAVRWLEKGVFQALLRAPYCVYEPISATRCY